MTNEGIGASVLRREDKRFITGKGRYTDDIGLAGQAYAVMVRSSVAHGVIRGIDTEAAKANNLVDEAVTANHIAQVVSRWTGVPVDKMLEGEKDKLLKMEEALGVLKREGDGLSPLGSFRLEALLYRSGFKHPGHTEYLAELCADGGPAPRPRRVRRRPRRP